MKAGKPKLVSTSQQSESPPIASPETHARSPLAEWLSDQQISTVVLLTVTAVSFYLTYIIFRPFLASIFLSFVLSIAFSPLHDLIARRIRSKTGAALLSTAIVVLFILVPCIFLSVKLLAQVTSLYGSLSQLWTSTGGLQGVSEGLNRVAEHTGIPYDQLRSEIAARSQQLGAWAVGMFGWATRGVAQQSMTALLIFFMLFFLLRDRDMFRAALFDLLPLPPGRLEELSAIVRKNIVDNIYGMFAVGATQGVLSGLGFWVTSLPAPLFWGIVAMIFSFVPLVGPILVWFPGALVLGLYGAWGKAILLFLWGAVLVSGADYLIRPRFAGSGNNANTLLILLSFFGGVRAFGVIGIFVGPVMLSLIVALLRILREERSGRSIAREETR
jgi:predicted PurR-regulated permease PerM